jgi:hypothetical protein
MMGRKFSGRFVWGFRFPGQIVGRCLVVSRQAACYARMYSHCSGLLGRLRDWLGVGWISDDGLSFGHELRNPKRTTLFRIITQVLLYISGSFIWGPVVAFCTITFNVPEFYITHARAHTHTHTHCICVNFIWISEQTAIISLYRIDFFITETECLLHGTDWIYVSQVNIRLWPVSHHRDPGSIPDHYMWDLW